MTETGKAPHTTNRKTKRLCLDFANTVDWHASDHPSEQLHKYDDLVLWAQGVGILTETKAHRLFSEAKRRPGEASKVLKRAITLREATYRVFSAVAGDRPPGDSDLATLNTELTRALARLQVTRAGDNFAWGWTGDEVALERILWQVARSAADLLTSEDLWRVGECADDRGCGWLFLDMSRNRSRRWCDMKDCGNRAKAKRHYHRKRIQSRKKTG